MKKKKIIILVVILVLILGGGTAGVLVWKNQNNLVEDTLGPNQSYVYGKIEEITGNSMNLALAEPVQVERSSMKGGSTGSGSDGSSGSNQKPSRGNREESSSGVKQQSYVTTSSDQGSAQGAPGANADAPSGGMPNGEMPSGGMPNGEMPGNSNGGQGQMPSEGNMAQAPSSSDDANTGENSSGSADSSQTTTVTVYNLTGDKAEYMIPVGTSVTTQLGAVTTFSRLAAGDYVKLLMEKDSNGNDVILQIWIVG